MVPSVVIEIPFNTIERYKAFKISFKYYSDTIQIHIIPPRTVHIVQWYLNGIFVRGIPSDSEAGVLRYMHELWYIHIYQL